jgi:hypothetical protein
MEVHAFFDERAENTRILAIDTQTFGHAVLLDDPERNRITAPNGFLGKAAHQDSGEQIWIRGNPLQKQAQGRFEFFELLAGIHFNSESVVNARRAFESAA